MKPKVRKRYTVSFLYILNCFLKHLTRNNRLQTQLNCGIPQELNLDAQNIYITFY